MNPTVEKYIVMALGATSAVLYAVPEWGQSKVGLGFLAAAAYLGGYLTPNMKSRQLARHTRNSLPPVACAFVLLGCGAGLPTQELIETQRHAQEVCKVIEQLPPIPQVVPAAEPLQDAGSGQETGSPADDGGTPGAPAPAAGGEPGAPTEPTSALPYHPFAPRRLGALLEHLGESLRRHDPARRGLARWQGPRRGSPTV